MRFTSIASMHSVLCVRGVVPPTPLLLLLILLLPLLLLLLLLMLRFSVNCALVTVDSWVISFTVLHVFPTTHHIYVFHSYEMKNIYIWCNLFNSYYWITHARVVIRASNKKTTLLSGSKDHVCFCRSLKGHLYGCK